MKTELPAIQVDILIVGAGPAGLAAAIAAKKAGVDSLIVLEREDNAGGILRQCIHNGFGLHRFKEELTGPEYAQRDIDTANEMEIDVRTGVTVLSVTKDKVVTAKVYPETWADFTAINRAQGMTNNSVINMLISEYVRNKKEILE